MDNDKLAALDKAATQGVWGIWREPIDCAEDAIDELRQQVEDTISLNDAVVLIDAGGKCPATTGCGPTSDANAAFITALVNLYRAGELVPVSLDTDTAGLVERPYLIAKGGYWYRAKAKGYTSSAIQAGRFSLEEAERHSHPNGPDGPRDGITFIHESDVDCPDLRTLRTITAERDALAKRVGDMRVQGQREGERAVLSWLRDRSACKPPASLWHAAEQLADQYEASHSPACATLKGTDT